MNEPLIANTDTNEVMSALDTDTKFSWHDDKSRVEAYEAAKAHTRMLTAEREQLAGRSLTLKELCEGIELPDNREHQEASADKDWKPAPRPAEPVDQRLEDLKREALMESRGKMSPAERKLFDYKMQQKDEAAKLELEHEAKLRQEEPQRKAALAYLKQLENEIKWNPERSQRELVLVQQTIRQWKEGADDVAEKMLKIIEQNEQSRTEKITFELTAKMEGLKNQLARLRKDKADESKGKKPPAFDDFYLQLSHDSFITKANAKKAYAARYGVEV